MKTAACTILFVLTLISCATQKGAEPDHTGVEYIQLKSELARGWNTWNTHSVLSHVLLPEAISVDFMLKDKKTNEVLEEALIGRRGENAESILPLAHAYDGSYTELEISWHGLELRIQSCTNHKKVYFLLTPLGDNSDGEVLICPGQVWWERDGAIALSENLIEFDLPSGKIQLKLMGKAAGKDESSSSCLAFSAASEIAISTDLNLSFSEVRNRIELSKAEFEQGGLIYGKEKDVHHVMQNVLAWDMIYEPQGERVLTTVSRIWNGQRGGFVIFCWDNYFAAYMHSVDNKQLAYANAIEITNAITASGFVPNLSASKGIKSSDRSQPPVGSMVVREIYRQHQEKWFLEEVFPKLLTWNRWWPQNRDTDGFLCWGSSPFEPYLRNLDRNAHSRYGAALESGLDNSPMYDNIPFDTARHQLKLADVGLMSLYIMDCESLSEIAGILGKTEIEKELSKRADQYRENLNKLWDESRGIYLNKRLDTNEFSDRISPVNFYPMLARAPSQDQAERMIKEHFYNPDEFWGTYILPSIAFNDPDYSNDDYWRGRIWAPMNFLVYLGLRNYDLEEARRDLVAKSKDLLLNQWQEEGYVCENYNPETGECDDVRRCDLFYHWGGLLGFISLIEEGYVQ